MTVPVASNPPGDSRKLSLSLVQTLKIIAASTLAAVIYGILHDQITARICVEYFTIE